MDRKKLKFLMAITWSILFYKNKFVIENELLDTKMMMKDFFKLVKVMKTYNMGYCTEVKNYLGSRDSRGSYNEILYYMLWKDVVITEYGLKELFWMCPDGHSPLWLVYDDIFRMIKKFDTFTISRIKWDGNRIANLICMNALSED